VYLSFEELDYRLKSMNDHSAGGFMTIYLYNLYRVT